MKALLYTIMIFGCLSLGSVCCKNVCLGGNPVFQLRVASKIDSTNLLFGTNKQYVFNKNMFFNKALTDSFFFRNIKFNCYILPDQTKDSVLDISLSIEANKIYFQLPNNSLDSFEFTFKDYDPNSCDAYFSIEQVKFNQNLIQPDNRNYYYTIYK
jgi:hypothetical protein